MRAASPGALRRVLRDPDIEGAAAAHGKIERPHRLFERSLRVRAVVVENVHVIQPHALEALVEAGDQVLARAPIAVRPGPHVPPGFGGDDKLVAERGEVLFEDPAETLLRRSVGGAVIVGEIEMGNPQVEGAAQHRPAVLERFHGAPVVPQAKGNEGELQAAPAAAFVGHPVVSVLRRHVGHGSLSLSRMGFGSAKRTVSASPAGGRAVSLLPSLRARKPRSTSAPARVIIAPV